MHHLIAVKSRAVALIWVMVTATAMHAHHSFAALYDANQAIRVRGTVETLEWKNPHVTLTLAVRDASGIETHWAFEMGAPRVLTMQFGWTPESLKVGDQIVVEGSRARNGKTEGAAQFVTTSAGVRLRAVRPFR
jgi:hypothetical protein